MTISKIIFIDRSNMIRKQIFYISEPLADTEIKLLTYSMYYLSTVASVCLLIVMDEVYENEQDLLFHSSMKQKPCSIN